MKSGEIKMTKELVVINSTREAYHYPLISKYFPMPLIIQNDGSNLIVEKVDFIYDLRKAIYGCRNFLLGERILEDIINKASFMWQENRKKANLGLSLYRAELSETIIGLKSKKEIHGVVEKAIKRVKKELKREPPFVSLIHGDLKGSNVLVISEKPIFYKVIDLEWSTEFGDPVEEATRIFKWVSSVIFKEKIPSQEEINELKRFQEKIEEKALEKLFELEFSEKYIEEMRKIYLIASYLREMFLIFQRIPETRQTIARDFLRETIKEIL